MREKRANRAGYVVFCAGYELSLIGYNKGAHVSPIGVPLIFNDSQTLVIISSQPAMLLE